MHNKRPVSANMTQLYVNVECGVPPVRAGVLGFGGG